MQSLINKAGTRQQKGEQADLGQFSDSADYVWAIFSSYMLDRPICVSYNIIDMRVGNGGGAYGKKR